MGYKDDVIEKVKSLGFKLDKKFRKEIRPLTGAVLLELADRVIAGGQNTPSEDDQLIALLTEKNQLIEELENTLTEKRQLIINLGTKLAERANTNEPTAMERKLLEQIDGQKTVAEIIGDMGYELTDSRYSSTSYALKRLRLKGLVDFKKRWKHRVYFKLETADS